MNIDRREQAFIGTNTMISLILLEYFPHLGAIPSPRDPEATCYQDIELGGAIACSAQEGFLLNELVRLASPKRMLEIGCYIGWSTAHLLYGNRAKVTCVDPFIEGPGLLLDDSQSAVRDRFIANMDRLGMWPRVKLVQGLSPSVLPMIAPKKGWDFVFLDGWHFNEQPQKDVRGLLPHLAENAIVVLHDAWMHDVAQAAKILQNAGFWCQRFDTANEMSVLWRAKPEWWNEFEQEFSL